MPNKNSFLRFTKSETSIYSTAKKELEKVIQGHNGEIIRITSFMKLPDVLYDIYRKFTDGSIPVEEMRAYFEGYGMHIGHPSDALMAAHIRRIFGQHEDGMILHIGGIFHMIELGEAPTLLRLLKDLNPERLLLADF